MQITDTIVMVSPDTFGYNPETAESNPFQVDLGGLSLSDIRRRAKQEFESMVQLLSSHGIEVVVLPSPAGEITPDAVFPNNWFTTHQDGGLVVYPLLGDSRRIERQTTLLKTQLQERGLRVNHLWDLSPLEANDQILEGTGSMICDHKTKVIFANRSPRTKEGIFRYFCQKMGYHPFFFEASDHNEMPYYHTNLIMSIGQGFAVVCLEAVKRPLDKKRICDAIKALNLTRIDISINQVARFCGNILNLKSIEDNSKIVMSQTAYDAFSPVQKKTMEQFGELVPVQIQTIETIGGGSARCMMGEVFLPKVAVSTCSDSASVIEMIEEVV